MTNRVLEQDLADHQNVQAVRCRTKSSKPSDSSRLLRSLRLPTPQVRSRYSRRCRGIVAVASPTRSSATEQRPVSDQTDSCPSGAATSKSVRSRLCRVGLDEPSSGRPAGARRSSSLYRVMVHTPSSSIGTTEAAWPIGALPLLPIRVYVDIGVLGVFDHVDTHTLGLRHEARRPATATGNHAGMMEAVPTAAAPGRCDRYRPRSELPSSPTLGISVDQTVGPAGVDRPSRRIHR